MSGMDSDYQRSKCATWLRFLRFMGARASEQTAHSCGPSDVVDFLVASDVSGQTVVHSARCDAAVASATLAPAVPRPTCSCPRRFAFGSVDSMIGRIRSGFADEGRLGQDNPAAHRVVEQYLADIRGGRLRRGVVPRQAGPVFAVKIRKISAYIRSMLDVSSEAPVVDDSAGFAMLRTRAMSVLDVCSLKKGAELGSTLTDSVVRFRIPPVCYPTTGGVRRSARVVPTYLGSEATRAARACARLSAWASMCGEPWPWIYACRVRNGICFGRGVVEQRRINSWLPRSWPTISV